MGIEEDLDSFLIDLNSKLDISHTVSFILGRFDRIIEKLSRGENIRIFESYDFIPPTLRKLVREYTSGRIDAELFSTMANETKIEAREYFARKGYITQEAEHSRGLTASFTEAAA